MLFNPEEAPIFGHELTPGEVRAWAKLYAIETANNALLEALTSIRDQFLDSRNTFMDELSAKYGIDKEMRKHVTFDRLTKRLVSAFHPELHAFKMEGRPASITALAYNTVNSAMRDLIGMSLAEEAKREMGYASTTNENGDRT